MLRLLLLLGPRNLRPVVSASRAHRQELQAALDAMRRDREGSANDHRHLELQQALRQLDLAISDASEVLGDEGPSKPSAEAWRDAGELLSSLEGSVRSEMRYVYGPDWELKPGKLVSKKGTWLKPNTQFSWELTEDQKLYLPLGVVMPIIQIGKVSNASELKRHDWVAQHLLVWMKPSIVRTLEDRRNVWFVYGPHWEEHGLTIIANSDTWLKRSTQMSNELQPFELIYFPCGMTLHLSKRPAPVDEEWEKNRHSHVHLHRRVVLSEPAVTVKQEQYDIFIGQGDDRLLIPNTQLPPRGPPAEGAA